MSERTCKDCRFFSERTRLGPSGDEYLSRRCKRYPVEVPVPEEEWCGEWSEEGFEIPALVDGPVY